MKTQDECCTYIVSLCYTLGTFVFDILMDYLIYAIRQRSTALFEIEIPCVEVGSYDFKYSIHLFTFATHELNNVLQGKSSGLFAG